jgi:hypothetical protein
MAAAYLCLASFFTWAFYVRYWEWRECIAAAASSCVTPADDNLTTGGAFWAVPAALFWLAAGRRWLRRSKRREVSGIRV